MYVHSTLLTGPAGSSDEQNPLLQADEKIKVGDPEEATSPPGTRNIHMKYCIILS